MICCFCAIRIIRQDFLIEPQLLARIMEKCRRCGIFLMIDECFLDFVEHGDLYSMKAGLPDNPEFFILESVYETVCDGRDSSWLRFMRQSETAGEDGKDDTALNVSIPAQAAGCAALKETEYVRMAQRLVNEQREYLKREMQKLPLSVYDSKANYIFSGAGGFIRAMPEKES